MPRKAFQGQKFLPVPCVAGPESLRLDLLVLLATSTWATTALLFLKRGRCWGIFNKGSGPGGLRVRSGYGQYSRGGSSLKCRAQGIPGQQPPAWLLGLRLAVTGCLATRNVPLALHQKLCLSHTWEIYYPSESRPGCVLALHWLALSWLNWGIHVEHQSWWIYSLAA